jgi:N-acetylglutamate synthase-like GNAT family acetyltransferase
MNQPRLREITQTDLPEIARLQPEGWSDIVNAFQYYIEKEFCYPVCLQIKGNIIGVGACISFGLTGWVAHIIVDPDFRDRGYGSIITNFLMEALLSKGSETLLLIATEMGMPLYRKLGFLSIMDYRYLRLDGCRMIKHQPQNVRHFSSEFCAELLKMDRLITGESRGSILNGSVLRSSILYIDGTSLTGFYIPEAGEGPILALSEVAGLELMKLKYSNTETAVLPSANAQAIKFLIANGFIDSGIRGTRMQFGKEIKWYPEYIYGRTGGNLG